jgi:hypothetical protein
MTYNLLDNFWTKIIFGVGEVNKKTPFDSRGTAGTYLET